MASETDVANLALDACGADRITALDDGTANANRALLAFGIERDACLREHIWNFGVKRKPLATTAAPVEGFNYAYGREAADLRVISINEDPDAIWQIEGRTIVTDETVCVAKYIERVTNPDLWDALFVSAFVLRLAARLATAISHDLAYSAKLLEQYYFLINSAQNIDGMEGTADTIKSTALTTDVRNG